MPHIETFRWYELKDKFLKFTGDGPEKGVWPTQPTMESLPRDEWTNTSWVGDSVAGMRKKIRDGYNPPELVNIEKYTPMSDRRRIRPAEEGNEIDFTRAWSGDPTPFAEWELRKSKPGMRIVAEMSMHCGTPAAILADYGAWIAGIMHGLETQGYDIELDVALTVKSLMTDDGYGDENLSAAMIRVTDEGEYSDFEEWSALFSPGGFRILGFVAFGMLADKVGKQAETSLGYPTGSKWDTTWNPSEQTLTISCPNGAHNFPADDLTQSIREHGLID
jgi:hypothetical protein